MDIETELTVAQLAARYANGERIFRAIEIPWLSDREFPIAADLNLDGAQFLDSCFHSCTFQGVSFRKARFHRCNLKCVTFDRCDLTSAQFEQCSVCSLEIVGCTTDDLEASNLDAYGAPIANAEEFLYYVRKDDRSPSA